MQAVRALVVDDSAIFRMLVNNALAAMPGVNVVARCRDGKQAIDAIRAEKPDLVTLDVEMPVMDGLQTLREIRKLSATESTFSKVKVVLLSALTKQGTDTTIQGLQEGAMECIPKPAEGDVDKNQEILKIHLQRAVDVVRIQLDSQAQATAATAPTVPRPKTTSSFQAISSNTVSSPKGLKQKAQLICIGVSTGGPAALSSMLPELSSKTHLPIMIVQHMPPGFTKSLAESLAKKCRHKVVEASEGDVISDDSIFIAPGGKHMIVVSEGGQKKVSLNEAPLENGCRPAVDVMFRSIAEAYGGKVCAVILTGMGSDGTLGAKPLRGHGATVIVQDKASSVVWGMPGSAYEAGVADEVVPLMQIPDAVIKAL